MIKLKKDEADRLIKMLKRKAKEQVLNFPNEGGNFSFDVFGERRDDRLVISLQRNTINQNSCAFQGRIRSNNIIVMRLDINPSAKHVNPRTGETIIGSHIHIYDEEMEMREAIPFDIKNRDLYNICQSFFERFNIIEAPTINQQLTIFDIVGDALVRPEYSPLPPLENGGNERKS